MDIVALTVGLGWTIAGVVCIVLAIPLALGRIGRNSFYGARFQRSLESDEAWQLINRFAGKQMIVWSIPLIIVGLVSFFLPLQSHVMLTIILGFAPLLFVLMPAFNTWRFAQQIDDQDRERL